jgi:hypothetical protein
MSTRTRKRMILFPLVLILLAATATLAPSASAAGTVVGTISPASVPAGASQATSFTIAPTSGQVGSFNLTAPTGWVLSELTPAAGVTLDGNQIQGRNLGVSSSLTINFTALAPCSPSSGTWGLVAKSNGNFNGATLGNDPASVLSVTLTGTCTATFVTAPADAAFNGGTKSENITGVPYDPAGAAVQAIVKDATGAARAGIAITLLLSGGTSGAALSGPTSAISDTNGLATFDGTANPLAINKTGLNYVMTPTGSGISGTSSGTFSIFQEGESCTSGQSCEVHGTSTKINATISATAGGNLGGSVEPISVVAFGACEGADPLSEAVIVWKYTAQGAQTVAAVVDKSLLRTNKGSAHIEVCFEVDAGKDPFIDKFGQTVTKGLLPDCGPGVSVNCIASETGLNGGGRLIVFTVEDGKGRI